MQAVGSRAKVWHGTAAHTSGGLTKADLKKNKHGRIVSRARSEASARTAKSSLGSYLIPKGSHINPFEPHCRKGKRCGKTCIRKSQVCHL